MRIFGLTGGIASGKSTVGRMFRALGAPVVDADLLAREVVAPGTEALAEIVEHFGADVLQADGTLDRKQLGAIVFADPSARETLNAITHPRIAQAGKEAIARLADAGKRVALYEAALIVENRLHEDMQGLIVVSIPEDVQLERLQRRDGITEAAARSRIESQLPLSEKLALADFEIDNSGSEDETRQQVTKVWDTLQGESQ